MSTDVAKGPDKGAHFLFRHLTGFHQITRAEMIEVETDIVRAVHSFVHQLFSLASGHKTAGDDPEFAVGRAAKGTFGKGGEFGGETHRWPILLSVPAKRRRMLAA